MTGHDFITCPFCGVILPPGKEAEVVHDPSVPHPQEPVRETRHVQIRHVGSDQTGDLPFPVPAEQENPLCPQCRVPMEKAPWGYRHDCMTHSGKTPCPTCGTPVHKSRTESPKPARHGKTERGAPWCVDEDGEVSIGPGAFHLNLQDLQAMTKALLSEADDA